MDWLLQWADPGVDWSYAIITLIVRFAGVFAVMLVMQVVLALAARGVRMIEGRTPGASRPDDPAVTPAAWGEPAAGLSDGAVAAIGVALALERRGVAVPRPARASAWAMAGRLAQLDRAPRRGH
jgi:hypothetical protein